MMNKELHLHKICQYIKWNEGLKLLRPDLGKNEG